VFNIERILTGLVLMKAFQVRQSAVNSYVQLKIAVNGCYTEMIWNRTDSRL